MVNNFQYCNTFWSFHVHECDFGPNLDDLVRYALWRSEDCAGTFGNFYAMGDDGWYEVDVLPIKSRLLMERVDGNARSPRYGVWVFGPVDTEAQLMATTDSVEEAESIAAAIPPLLNAVVDNVNRGPRR